METYFEIAKLHHNGKHHMRLLIDINSNIRYTLCVKCMEFVKWERVEKIKEANK